MSLKLTILGCGSSGGVPRLGGNWGACDPDNPRNRRKRCSVLVERTGPDGITRVLVDASPDLREQLLGAGAGVVDGVLFTHQHADHTHGIDELRVVAINRREQVKVWADDVTAEMLQMRFSYCFKAAFGTVYPPILDLQPMVAGEMVRVEGAGGDIEALPFVVNHGAIDSLGFRFGEVAYVPDVCDIPDTSLAYLNGLDVWIIDALRRSPHPTHFSLDDALSWIKRVRPRRAVLTNMHVDMDYAALCSELPGHIRPAHDGLVIEIAPSAA